MSYEYTEQRPWIFTDEGQRALLRVRDFAFEVTKVAGAVRADKLMSASKTSDSWNQMACVDRLVELGDLVPAYSASGDWQHRVYRIGRE